MELSSISSSFFKNLSTVGLIVLAVIYLEDRFKTIAKESNDSIKEAVQSNKEAVESHTVRLNKLEMETSLSNYKWAIYEDQFKDILKNKEFVIKSKK